MKWIIAVNIILGIVLFIILIFSVIIFLPIRLIVKYEGKKLNYKVRVLCFDLDPDSFKFIGRGKNKNKKDKPEKKRKDGGLRKTLKSLGYAKSVLKNAGRLITFIIKKIKFKKLVLKIDIGSDSADKTAIIYGSLCSTVYPMFSALFEINEPKDYEIRLRPSFDENSSNIIFCLDMKMRVIGFLLIAFEFYKILHSDSK